MRALVDLKVGDVLFEPNRMGHQGGTLHTVERLTATRVFCGRGHVFRLKDGNRVGDTSRWSTSWVRKATKDDFDAQGMRDRLYKATVALGRVRVDPSNLDAIEAMLEAIAKKVPADAAQ